MSSDEEDFNDIYGDDEPSTTTEEYKNVEVATESVEENEQDNITTSVNSSSENDHNNNSATEEVSNSNNNDNNVSSLDQLAALQALSSNLNQINNNNNSDNANKDASSNSNDSTVNSENKTALPWEQLQQTMSQFNPQQSQQQQQTLESNNEAQKRVKADISKDNCKMFIGGLNWETTEEGLRNYFNKYGHVIDLKIMKDPNTGRSRGFGFLTFESPSSVDEVVKTQHILDGKVIDPKRSIPREEQDKTGKIFVGGIGADVRPKEFEEFFAKYGTIIDAQLMLDKDTGRSRGFGFVTYDSPEAVDRVCENKYIEFKGKQIEIKRAEPRHLQKGQYGGANPNNRNSNNYNSHSMNMGTGANSVAMNPAAAAMYQNPMVAGFNPMMPGFNPQAMQEYYQKMQEYYQQMQQQTGIDYTQMYQQQMQQMAMMMPGFVMPTQQPQTGSQSPQSGSTTVDNNGSNSVDVQTIGENSDTKNNNATNDENGNINNNNNSNSSSNNMDRDNKSSNDSRSNTPDVNIPRGPKDPSSIPSHGGYPHRERGDRGDRRGRRVDRGGYRGGSGNNYRGGRSGYNRRNNNGYHPYNR